MNVTRQTTKRIFEIMRAVKGIPSFLDSRCQSCFLLALTSALSVVPAQAGLFAYVTTGDTVSVIDTATDTVVATVPVGGNPFDVVAHPDGTRVYVGTLLSKLAF